MQAFICLAMLAAASAAPQLLVGRPGLVGHGLVSHAVHAPLVHSVPVVHAAPLVHSVPVVRPAYGAAEVYPDEISPYTFNYAVADDYSASNFNAAESNDGAGNAQGSYNVNLPDGRIQHVNYHSDPVNGYVAEVTYDGAAVYPDAPAYHAPVVAAAPAYHAPLVASVVHAAPAYHAAPLVHATPVLSTGLVAGHVAGRGLIKSGLGQVSHQSVSKPFQGEHRATTQSKAFGASVAAVHDRPNALHGAHSQTRLAVVGHGPVVGHGGVFIG